jgi:hypothetical protein
MKFDINNPQMENRFGLEPGKEYIVIKPFVDYDGITHTIGERWIYQGTNFHPYEDGLTFYVLLNGEKAAYRLQQRDYAQEEIIENFKDYVELVHIESN